jgi:hypothetical protein
MAGPNNPCRIPDVIKNCKYCGGEFSGGKGWKKDKKFCSYDCVSAWRNDNHAWRPKRRPIGSVHQDSRGYRFIKVSKNKWVEEHRLVLERHLDRALSKDEVVHHINGNPSDNRPENLVAMTKSNHQKLHYEIERLGFAPLVADSWIPSPEGLGC